MSIVETIIAVGILSVALLWFVAEQGVQAERREAALMGAAFADLHEATEEYLRDTQRHQELLECFRHPDGNPDEDVLEDWRSGEGHKTTPFRSIPLFDLGDMAMAWGEEGDDSDIETAFGPVANVACGRETDELARPMGLAEAGLLPPSFRGLAYANGQIPRHGRRGIQWSFVVRMVDLNGEPGDPRTADPALQGLLVGVPESVSGEGTARYARRVASLAGFPDAGTLASSNPTSPESDARRRVLGTAGAWSMSFCFDAGSQARDRMGDLADTSSYLVVDECEGARSPLDSLYLGGSGGNKDLERAFGVMGFTTSLTGWTVGSDHHQGRIVATTLESRDSVYHELLYRVDTGDPEQNRMETDVDFGGWGGLNLAYLGGIDSDGDGAVDRGIQIVGGTEEARTVVHGDLEVRGNVLVVSPEDADGNPVADTGRVESRDMLVSGAFEMSGKPWLDPVDPDTPGVHASGRRFRVDLGDAASGEFLAETTGAELRAGTGQVSMTSFDGSGDDLGQVTVSSAGTRVGVDDNAVRVNGDVSVPGETAFRGSRLRRGVSFDQLGRFSLGAVQATGTGRPLWTGCPDGADFAENVAVPQGWRREIRSDRGVGMQEVVTDLKVDGGNLVATRNEIPLPYEGWSTDPRTGFDDGIGASEDADGNLNGDRRGTILVFCDLAPEDPPAAP